METRKNRRLLWAGAIAGALVLAAAGWYLFAPKPEQQRAEAAPEGRTLASGQFRDGETFHKASGTVRLLEVDGRHVLRFEGYDATPGPDVYLYLTPRAHASTTADVEGAGIKIRTPTAMGQATLRGDFNLDVPPGVDVSAYAGVSAWCDTYNVLFGSAELTRA